MPRHAISVLAIGILSATPLPALAHLHPAVGKFAQRDRVGYRDGLNLTGYEQSEPNMRRDPTGLVCLCKDPFAFFPLPDCSWNSPDTWFIYWPVNVQSVCADVLGPPKCKFVGQTCNYRFQHFCNLNLDDLEWGWEVEITISGCDSRYTYTPPVFGGPPILPS